MTTMQQDVVDLLVDQHRDTKDLFSKVAAAKGERRRALFEDLVRFLAVHESAEEVVVHPAARKRIAAGNEVVERRLREENEAKDALAELYDLGVDHPEFDGKLAALAEMVLAHAGNEEREEFTALRDSVSREELLRMANSLEAAEQVVSNGRMP
jgi:hemerythrin superfamily protein